MRIACSACKLRSFEFRRQWGGNEKYWKDDGPDDSGVSYDVLLFTLTRSSTLERKRQAKYVIQTMQEHSEIKLSGTERRHSKRMRDHAKKQDKKSSGY